MKYAFIIYLFIVMGCNEKSTSDNVKAFIPGVYVRHYKDEFTNSFDTLEIKKLTSSGSEGFMVVKKMKYERLNQKNTSTFNMKKEEWIGIYENNSKTLLLEPEGKRVYFDPEMLEAKMGFFPYKKIK